jgi:predicted TPR repeat methyltransferase
MTHQILDPSKDATDALMPPAAKPAWEAGRELRLAGRLHDAVRLMQRASRDERQDIRLHDELGTALSELNRQEEAIGWFMAALELAPDRDDLCNKIGEAFCSRGMFKPAVDWFDHARQINPIASGHHYSYGRSLAAIGCVKLASEIFEEWIKVEPGNPIARHLASATLGGHEATKASREYVCALFDGCASRFDGSLARLHYSGPQILLSTLQDVASKPEAGWEILDVGCGTGLVGAALKPLARRLVGVDLSAGMLGLARERGVYDELVEADLIDYLGTTSNRFDVVTASDVLTYLGDLSGFFELGAKVLRPGGLIAVVAETLDGGATGQTFRLNPTGRFSHSPEYLRSLIEDLDLSVAYLRDVVMRWEANQPVPSLVAVARTPAEGLGRRA